MEITDSASLDLANSFGQNKENNRQIIYDNICPLQIIFSITEHAVRIL